jgi:hypothetical protein
MLFLGGFIWVVGAIFQQFAAKYLGIGRGIPLSNSNVSKPGLVDPPKINCAAKKLSF